MSPEATLLAQAAVFFGSYAVIMLVIAYVGYDKGWWK
jgi:hypothetical protein